MMTITELEIQAVDAYWRAANFLGAAMIHLKRLPIDLDDLQPDDVKRRILGHWGSSPGQAFVWAHANRLLKHICEDMIYLSGPGHGAPGMIGPVFLDGDYARVYRDVPRSWDGASTLCARFSAPGGIGSHCTPETPGSIHEGGELGYVLSHAAGAVLDKPNLIALAVVGDGEAETGPLATAWNICRLLRPQDDGAVLPVLHLNGYKIANPTLMSRVSDEQLYDFFAGYGWDPLFVDYEGSNARAHWAMAEAMEDAHYRIKLWRQGAGKLPVIVLRTPKGWTGPAYVDGKKVEGYWRSHQVPLPKANQYGEQFEMLKAWLKSYKPEELFLYGKPAPIVLSNVPESRMAQDFWTQGYYPLEGVNAEALEVPVEFGKTLYENTNALGEFCRELYKKNTNFRVFGPDETASNRLQAVYQETKKMSREVLPVDDKEGGELSNVGRVIEMLSEHTLVGMLEGYLMTGGAGLFHTYEAFAHVISSMAIQHSKWLAATAEHAPWRESINSWNCLLSSTVWRQDHNGGTHQQPGFIDIACNMNPDTVRVYLPADANTLLAVSEVAFSEPDVLNFIVADKQKHLQYFSLAEARELVARGAIEVRQASDWGNPDVILAAAGDVVFKEVLAAAEILRAYGMRVMVVNVCNLFALGVGHAHSLSKDAFQLLFPPGVPVVFNFHGYAGLVKRLLFDRGVDACLDWHIHGFKERGSINTPFELTIINEVDRYSLAIDALEGSVGTLGRSVLTELDGLKQKALAYAYENGVDDPCVDGYTFGQGYCARCSNGACVV